VIEKKKEKPKASQAKKNKKPDSGIREKSRAKKDRSNKNKNQRQKRDDEYESESEEPIISQGDLSETEREGLGSASFEYENSEEELVKRAESKIANQGATKNVAKAEPPTDSRRIKTETSRPLPDIVLKKPEPRAKERKKTESSISSFIDDKIEEYKFSEDADSQSEEISKEAIPERKSTFKPVVPDNTQRKKKVFMVDEDEDE